MVEGWLEREVLGEHRKLETYLRGGVLTGSVIEVEEDSTGASVLKRLGVSVGDLGCRMLPVRASAVKPVVMGGRLQNSRPNCADELF